jgi:hypothetical protein
VDDGLRSAPLYYLLGFFISHKALVMGLVRIFYGLL